MKYLLLCWFPEIEQQTVIYKALQFLAITIITNANYRNLGYLDAGNKISNSTSITSRHAVNFVHYEYSLRLLCPVTWFNNLLYLKQNIKCKKLHYIFCSTDRLSL